MTLESVAAAQLRLAVWCKACGHRSEPDPAEQARWYGPETPVPEWRPAAGVLTMRQPRCRHGGDRDEAVRRVHPRHIDPPYQPRMRVLPMQIAQRDLQIQSRMLKRELPGIIIIHSGRINELSLH